LDHDLEKTIRLFKIRHLGAVAACTTAATCLPRTEWPFAPPCTDQNDTPEVPEFKVNVIDNAL